MNFYEKIAQAAKQISELGVPTQERIPNRQEVRYYRSLERRNKRKLRHMQFLLKQLMERPTAHWLPKRTRLNRLWVPFPGRALKNAQVATGGQS